MSVTSSERLWEPPAHHPRDPQKLARIAGAFFVTTFVSSIGALILYDPVDVTTACAPERPIR